MVEPRVPAVHVHHQRARHVLRRRGRRAYVYQTADHSSYLLFVTGFLGGFSTFSTAINEMVSLARSGKYAAAAVYFMMTVLVPVVCVALGWGLIALVR